MIETTYGLKRLNSRHNYCINIIIIGSFLVRLYLVPCVALTFVLLKHGLLYYSTCITKAVFIILRNNYVTNNLLD